MSGAFDLLNSPVCQPGGLQETILYSAYRQFLQLALEHSLHDKITNKQTFTDQPLYKCIRIFEGGKFPRRALKPT